VFPPWPEMADLFGRESAAVLAKSVSALACSSSSSAAAGFLCPHIPRPRNAPGRYHPRAGKVGRRGPE